MPAQPYLWLRDILDRLLPELADLPAGAEGEARARAWFARLLARFAERGLKTPAQQKNRVVDARNAIRARFGDDHPSLAFVGFDEATWQKINLPGHDRTEARNENQRLLRDPEQIVERAGALLGSAQFEDLAVGLAVATGRRISELLDGHARFEAATAWSVLFTGQRKHRGDRESFCFEIPTLRPAADVRAAWERLRVMLGDGRLDPRSINNRYGHAVNQAADRHFRGLVPPRLPPAPVPGGEGRADDPHGRARRADALYLHLFRAVYAALAVHWFCPPRVNRTLFKAEIQGHRQILHAEDDTMRRSYAASRHYDDYQVADRTGKNIDGRQGIKLGTLPGLEVLAVFREPPTAAAGASGPPPDLPEPARGSAPGLPGPEPVEPEENPMPPDDQTPRLPLDAAPPALPSDTEGQESPPAAPEGAGGAEPSAESQGAPAGLTKPRRPRPGLYRIHAEDRLRLDAMRADVKMSQADNLHLVVERADGQRQAREELRAAQEAAQAHASALAAECDAARREAEELRARLAAQEEQTRRLEAELDAARRPASNPPDAGASIGLARELLDLALQAVGSPLQAPLLALAARVLGGLPGGPGAPADPPKGRPARGAHQQAGGAAAPADPPAPADALPAVPFALVAEVAREGMGGQPAPLSPSAAPLLSAAPPPSAAPPALADTPGRSEVPTPAMPPPGPQPGRRRGGVSGRLARAVEALFQHNDAQASRDQKWAVTESAVARWTGCFRPAVRAHFAAHAAEIEAHNQRHHLGGGHNAARGRRGQRLEDEVGWRPGPELPSEG